YRKSMKQNEDENNITSNSSSSNEDFVVVKDPIVHLKRVL
ncbi:26975_t:CDS:1, partial [Gigaspora margarita]